MGTYTYDPSHSHAVASTTNGWSFQYDANGNQTSRTATGGSYALSYDAENRLVGVSGAATATFVYDGDGKRVKATINSVTTTYIGNYYETSGGSMRKYYFFGALRVAMRQDSNLFFLLGDHLGNSSLSYQVSNGVIIPQYYKPWGEIRPGPNNSLPTDYTFTGQKWEASLSLMFFNARWYDNSLGHFIQADSIIPTAGDTQSWDRYAYTNNNPATYVDKTGHRVERAIIAGDGDVIDMDVVIKKYSLKFSGDWTIKHKAAILLGVQSLGKALSKFTLHSTDSTIKETFGSLTFTVAESANGICQANSSGVSCGVNVVADSRLFVHELGHTFSAIINNNGYLGPYSDLARAAIVNNNGDWITGSHGGVFERTFLGYKSNDDPSVYHGSVDFDDWNSPGEDFADMFVNWTYNSFDYRPRAYGAGYNRYSWMETNMANWVSKTAHFDTMPNER